MKIKISPQNIIAFVIAIIGTMIWYMISASINWEERAKDAGSKVISKIEEYQKDKGTLPNSLNEIGIEEKNGITLAEDYQMRYERSGDSDYLLLIVDDESRHVVYSSASGVWETYE